MDYLINNMNREFKFRVWLENAKRMVYPHDNLVCIYDDGACNQHYSLCLLQNLEENFYNNSSFYPDRYVDLSGNKILQQFTGLQDSNGKDIYEGDIVEYIPQNAFNVFPKRIKRIEYSKYGYLIEGDEGHCSEDCVWLYQVIDFYNVKVIGNIFENPELLKN